MRVLGKLEAQSAAYVKRLPFQLPPDARESLAGAAWLIALVLGVVQLWSAHILWRAGERANELADAANYLSRLYGAGDMAERVGVFFYVSLCLLVLQGVLMLLAIPGLKTHRKAKGWDYLWYTILLSVVYGFFRVFSEIDGGVGNFLIVLFGVVVGGYLLFQIRSLFSNDRSPAVTSQGSKKA